jgi:cytoskeletal protein CcmA (bactofilin family)
VYCTVKPPFVRHAETSIPFVSPDRCTNFVVLTAFQGSILALCFDNKIGEWYSKFALNGGTKHMAWFDRTTGSKKMPEPQPEQASEAPKWPVDPAQTAAVGPEAQSALPKVEAASKPIEPEPIAYLYKGSRVTGQLSFQGAVRIDGSVDGEIQCQGTLTIGEGADIRAKLSGRVVVLRGKVEGNVTAKERLELIAPARLIGNVDTPRLLVTEGVVFDGNCAMGTAKQKGGLTSQGVNGDKPAAAQITKLQADSNS